MSSLRVPGPKKDEEEELEQPSDVTPSLELDVPSSPLTEPVSNEVDYGAYFKEINTQESYERGIEADLESLDPSTVDYAAYFAEEETRSLAALKNNLHLASLADAEQAAEIKRLSDASGLPPSFIKGNVDQVQRMIELAAMDAPKLAAQSPVLARQLTDPLFAAIAYSDIEELSAMEEIVTGGANFGKSLLAGLYNFSGGAYDVLGAVPASIDSLLDATGVDTEFSNENGYLFGKEVPFLFSNALNIPQKVSEGFRSIAEGQYSRAEYLTEDLSRYNPTIQSAFQGIQSVGMMAPGLMATLLTGNPVFMYGAAGTSSFGGSYDAALDEGLSQPTSFIKGVTDATIEVGTEMLPIMNLLKDLKMGSGFFKTLMHQLMYEVPQEQVATVLQEYTDFITLPSQAEMTFGDYLAQRPESAYHTLISTLTAVGTQTSATYYGNRALNNYMNSGIEPDPELRRMLEDEGRATEAMKAHENIIKLSEKISESKTAQLAPDSLKKFVGELFQSQTPGETPQVVIYSQDLAQYAEEQGIEVTDISPLITEQVESTLATQGFYSFKVEDYLTEIANSEHGAALNELLRINENAMSVAEANTWTEERNQKLLDQADEIIKKMTEEDQASGEEVFNEVVSQLENIGVPRDEANQSAALYKAFFTVMGDRAGMNPKELFDRYGVEIQRNLPEGVAQATQTTNLQNLANTLLKPEDAGTLPGRAIAEEAQTMGTNDGFLESTLEDIRTEDYIDNTIKVDDLIKSDPSLAEFLESNPEVREFEGDAFSMNPIVTSEGRVVDGYNRINQLIQDGVTDIQVLQGVASSGITTEQIQEVRDYLEKEMGLDLENTDATELADIIQKSFYDPQGRTLEQAAFHGTGFADVIDKFSTDYIGTGEGNQAFGWGMYFASQKAVADFYRATALDSGRFTHENFTVKKDNVELDITSDEHQLVVMAAYDLPLPLSDALNEVESRIEDLEMEYWGLDGMNYLDISYQEIEEAIKTGEVDRQAEEENGVITKAQKKELIRVADELMDEQAQLALGNEILSNEDRYEVIPDAVDGKTYQVELAPKDEDYLIWDYGIEAQSEKVQEIIKKLRKSHGLGNVRNMYSGQEVYQQMQYSVGTSTFTESKEASLELLENGIRGIKFADGNTRRNLGGEGKVDWNFVIFDAADVEITKVFNQGQEPTLEEFIDAKQGNTFFQTASIRSGQENLEKYGLDVTQRNNNAVVALALESRQRDKYGFIDFNDHSKEAQSKVAGWITAEIKHEVNKVSDENSAVGWYSTKFQQAIDTLGAKYPEFLDDKVFKKSTNPGLKALGNKQNARDFFTLLVAITSDGQKVQQNFALADQIYSEFKETGVLPEEGNFGGERIASMLRNMKRINKMVEEKGFEGTRDFLLQVKTVGELTKIAASQGLKFDSGFKVTAKMPMSTVVIGDKLGTFYANLMAREGYVTMDRWFSRTINRYRGDLLQKPTKSGLKRFRDLIEQPDLTDEETVMETIPYQKAYADRGFKEGTEIEKAANTIHKAAFGGMNDVPRNKSDREFMTNVMENARKRLKRSGIDLTVADMQAILWYYEKRLYGELGARASADISYEEAAERIINKEPAPFTQTAEGPGGTVVGLPNPTYDQMQRGSIQFRSSETVISLFEGADRSTFLHESGHLFLEIMRDLGEDAKAPDSIKEDWKKILNFLEVNSGAEIGTPQHEKWAESFEKYLFEGKAPSVELQGVFRRFKAWMISVYKQLTNLNVELNDDIRGIFDRMLATPAEIREAENVSRFIPMFENIEQSGMTQAEWNNYQDTANAATRQAEDDLDRKKLSEIDRERKKWYREELENTLIEVENEVNEMPVYQVIHFLQTGEALAGELDSSVEPMKLDKKELIAEFGQILGQLPRGRKIHTNKGGVHHELVAELFGYKSGQHMVSDIIKAKPRKQFIQEVAKDRLMKTYSDMRVNRDKLEEEAIKSSHMADQRSRFLQQELKALAKRANLPGTPANAAREAALNMIDRLKVQDLHVNRYRASELGAARAAEKAMLKEDWKEATKQKRAQLLNHHLYREAEKKKEEVEKFVRYFTRLSKPGARKRLARDYIDQIYNILEKIDIKKSVSKKARDRRASFAAWVMLQEQEGNEVVFTEKMSKLLESAEKTHYKDMTFAELREVYESVRNIEHIARWKQRLIDDKAKMDFDQTVDAMVDFAVNEHKNWKDEVPDFTESKLKRFKEGWRNFHAVHDKIEYIAESMDNFQTNGIWWRNIFKPIADASDAEMRMNERFIERMQTIMLDRYTRKERREWNNPVSTRVGTFNKKNILAIALNWGNEDNRIALLDGFKMKKNWDISTVDVENILDAHMEQRDWDMVQDIWVMIDELWPEVAALQKELTGIVPPKVEATPFMTKFGQMRGGYYPLSYDRQFSDKQRTRSAEQEAQELFENSYSRASTRDGHTNERVGSGGQFVRLDLDVLSEHMHNVIHDLTHRKPIMQVAKLIKNEEVQSSIQGVLGKEVYAELYPWLKAIAAPEPSYNGTLQKVANWSRHSATIVSMGWKVTTALVQPLGYSQSIAYLGEGWALKGLKNFYKNPKQNMDLILEKSAFMRNRTKTLDRDVRDSVKRIAGGDSALKDMESKYFYFIGMMDMTVSLPTWQAAYEKSLYEGMSESDAIAQGDSAVRMSQGSGEMKDMARIQQGGPLQKLFTMFYSYFSAYYNMSKRTIKQYQNDEISAWTAFRQFVWLTLMPAVISELMLGRGPDEDDEENFYLWATKQTLAFPFAGMVGVRDIVGAMFNPAFGTSLPYTDVYDSIISAGMATGDLFTDDEFNSTDVKNIIVGLGYMFKLPSRQAANIYEHLYEVFAEGEDLSLFELLVKTDKDD